MYCIHCIPSCLGVIQITITDVNDNHPIFTKTSAELDFSVPEATTGVNIGTVSANVHEYFNFSDEMQYTDNQ